MKLMNNYYSHITEFVSNHLNRIELSIIFIIFFLIIFHIVVQQIVFERILDQNIFQEHHDHDIEEYEQAYKKVRYYSSKIIILIGFLFFLIFATYEFIKHSENILKYSPFLGLIGAAITFALQEVVLSFAGWLGIFCGGFYFFGDRIKLGNIVGDVIDIGFLRTTLIECGDWVDGDLYNGRIVRIANSFVFKEPVFNYNSKFKFLWDEIKLPLTHESDYEKAKDIIYKTIIHIPEITNESVGEEWKKITNKYFLESARTKPQVHYSIDRNSIEFTIRYTVDYKQRRSTKDKVFKKILLELKKSGIKASIAKIPLEISPCNNSEELKFIRDLQQKSS